MGTWGGGVQSRSQSAQAFLSVVGRLESLWDKLWNGSAPGFLAQNNRSLHKATNQKKIFYSISPESLQATDLQQKSLRTLRSRLWGGGGGGEGGDVGGGGSEVEPPRSLSSNVRGCFAGNFFSSCSFIVQSPFVKDWRVSGDIYLRYGTKSKTRWADFWSKTCFDRTCAPTQRLKFTSWSTGPLATLVKFYWPLRSIKSRAPFLNSANISLFKTFYCEVHLVM